MALSDARRLALMKWAAVVAILCGVADVVLLVVASREGVSGFMRIGLGFGGVGCLLAGVGLLCLRAASTRAKT